MAAASPPTILIVDDDPTIRLLISRILRPHHVTLREAASAEEALECLAEQPIALMVLDVMLPGIDGLSLCRQLRDTAEFATLPILILTAMSGSDSQQRALAAGADDYLPKPFQPEELVVSVRALLG